MNFFQKVKRYERLSNIVEQFVNQQTGKTEGYPQPRVKVVLENGIEFILQKHGQSPRWSFKVRTDAKASCLGAKFNVKEQFIRRDKDGIHYDANEQSVDFVELSGSQQDYENFNKVLWEGFPENEPAGSIQAALACPEIHGIIDELKQGRDRFLAQLISMQSIVCVEFRDSMAIGLYVRHDNKSITISRDGKEMQFAFVNTEGMKKL